MDFKTMLPSREGKVWRNSALLLLALVGVPMLSFLPVDSRITGRVFRDFNANGVFDTTPIEIGVAGVTVTAYTPTGSSVTATTGADGTYSLVTVTGTKYRVEFTGLETGDFESAYGSATGNNGTSVQFAASGDVNVNLGVNYPGQYYSTATPKVVTSGFVSGNQSASASILWGASFNATSTGSAVATKDDLGTTTQLGSVWGTAYAKTSKKLYVAAFTKRHVGFGPAGAGGIYVTQLSGNLSAATPTTFYAFPDSEVGGASIHGTLPASSGGASEDTEAFDKVGKTSLGDIELSDDEQFLYVVNLYNRRLYKFPTAGGQPTWVAIPNPASSATYKDYRPFALKVYRNKVYVGVVASNESSYPASDAADYTKNASTITDSKGISTGMKAVVYEFDGTSFNNTPVLDFPLTYKKQPSNADITPNTAVARGMQWRPWTSIYRLDRNDGYFSYPQPWLTGIEFDVNGDMILGLRDRFGDQIGYENYRPAGSAGPGGTTTISAIAPGEVLRAGKSGSSWTIENKAVVNGSTPSTDQKKQFGPGGTGALYTGTVNSTTYFNNIANGGVEGKYYWGDQVDAGANHGASSLGGLAVFAGSGDMIMTAMDPNNTFNVGGIKRLNNSTGANDGGGVMYAGGVINWGKANGMGDVELLTAPAPIEIGNKVWIDKDSDGIQDGDETGLAGVSIQLLASNGTTVIATAVTDANGNYIFSSATGTNTASLIYGLTALAPNTNYSLRILNTSGAGKLAVFNGYSVTGADKDATTNGNNRDSDGIASGTITTAAVTTGNNGENDHSFDFGFAPVGSIGDYVWYDANRDGLQTSGELPAPNVTVTLQRSTDGGTTFTNFATATTGSDGKYLFSDLESGTYKVVFTKPTGYDFTTQGTTASSNTDSNPNPAGASGVITINTALASGDIGRDNLTIDAGLSVYGSLGDYVWYDTNYDGLQTTGEAVASGITVTLWKSTDAGTTWNKTFATATTGADGKYLFDRLESATYKVVFTKPTGYEFTTAGTTAASGTDSNAGTTGETANVSINVALAATDIGRNNLTIDAGLVAYGSLGDYVWYDTNYDGLQTTGEAVASGVTVTLWKSTDGGTTWNKTFATTTTGADGKYLFSNLESATYKVVFTKPAGYEFTTAGTTAASGTDSNAGTTGETPNVSINVALAATDIGRNNLTIDAGLVAYGSLGDYVWYDTNYDGLQTTGEAVASGIPVTLWKSTDGGTTWNKTFATTTTGSDGKYLFSGLQTATYKVVFTKPTGYEFTTTGTTAASGTDNNAGTTGETANVTINTALAVSDIGRNNLTIDAGLVSYGSIGDYVWYDSNYDGQQTTGEAVAPNIPVTLWKSTDGGATWNKTFATTTTGSDGKYLFSGLQTATYKVVFTKPSGFDFTTLGTTATSNTDSNVGATGESANISIDAALVSGVIGRDNLTIDAGLVAYGSIGDYVWLDANKDGSQTTGEAAVSGVTVKLWKLINGTTYNESFATTTTDVNGKYTFSGLQSGTYKVQFVLPGDKDFTLFQKSGIATTTNSDAGTNGLSDAVTINTTLASGNIGRDNPTIDAGLVAKGALPVTLTDFSGSKEGSTSVLKWNTTAETNSAYFEVQRSTDGKNWTVLGNVLALGESSDLHKYDFTDGNPLNGENLYRLKMVDADQSYAYSRIISIKLEVGYKLSVFPNPTSDIVKIETSNGANIQKVEVYSLIGKLVKEVVSPKGGEISVQQLPSGMYMLRITTSNGSVETRKVVVVR